MYAWYNYTATCVRTKNNFIWLVLLFYSYFTREKVQHGIHCMTYNESTAHNKIFCKHFWLNCFILFLLVNFFISRFTSFRIITHANFCVQYYWGNAFQSSNCLSFYFFYLRHDFHQIRLNYVCARLPMWCSTTVKHCIFKRVEEMLR